MSQNILVMGGSYFIGKQIVKTLLNQQYNVYTLNRGTNPPCDHRIHQINCDRNDSGKMKQVLSAYSFDVVIDVSGVNKEHEKKLLESLELSQLKKFIFISSSAVYDLEHLSIPYQEHDSLGENKYWTDYGKHKIDAETYLIEQFNKLGQELIILRPPYVYGEDNYAQRESFIFEHLMNNHPIIIPNQGQTLLQFIYTEDLAHIILTLIQRSLPNLSIFNVGNKQSITIGQWISYCEHITNKQATLIEYDYKKHHRPVRDFFPFHDYDNVLDVSKINEIYSYETDFETGLNKAFHWYCENKNNILFKETVTQNEHAILTELQAKNHD